MNRTGNKSLCCILFTALVTGIVYMSGCTSYDDQKRSMPDNRDSGIINISCDESFKPIIDEMVQVYESGHRRTKINVFYKPEADCLKDLDVDSIRMVIATRRASKEERDFSVDSFKTELESKPMALDGVAVIVHPQNPDSLFTMDEIKQVLTGKFRKNLIPVFDGIKATSTVRFIVDSVLRTDSLTPNAVAARTSEGVIDYISKKTDAIGFIGVSWIGNPDDSMQLSYLEKVKIVRLETTDLPGKYSIPAQANLFLHRYPMTRELVYILKERHMGLGNGFADFMNGDIGQLIFKRAYLVPLWKDFRIRPVQVTQ